MKPVIDISKEYGIVLEGGGAKGAYQIGAWKALQEAGVKICAVAGTSVGALNGALICMGDVECAEKLWETISYSKVMDVDDDIMEQLISGRITSHEALKKAFAVFTAGGADITPLKKLIADNVDEAYMRECGPDFYVLTFSLSDMKELDLSLDEIPEGNLKDILLASAYLPVFKKELLHGKNYMDGGMFNNVPLESLVKRDYKDIIMIRIFGVGREKKVKIPEDVTVITIEPRVNLGKMLEFDSKKGKRNIKIGYYDACRVIYGLSGTIYYIDEQDEEEDYCQRFLKAPFVLKEQSVEYYRFEAEDAGVCRCFMEKVLDSVAQELKLSREWTYKELYLAMLEATAKQLRIQKYNIYTLQELQAQVLHKYRQKTEPELPYFAELMLGLIEEDLT